MLAPTQRARRAACLAHSDELPSGSRVRAVPLRSKDSCMTTSRTDGTDVTPDRAGLDTAPATSAPPRRKQPIAIAMFAVLLLSYVVNAMDRQLYLVIAP